MSSKIVLNWCPPAKIEVPSPAHSILKSYLSQNGYEVDILYWNLSTHSLQNDFLWNNRKYLEENALFMFYNYISLKTNAYDTQRFLKKQMESLKLECVIKDSKYFDSHINFYMKKIDDFIENILLGYDLSNILYWGFSLKFDQWVFASIVAQKLKEINPDIIIVVGGIMTQYAAKSFLYNFQQFDIAMWGEGECSLLNLSRELEKNIDDRQFFNINNIAYRYEGEIVISSKIDKKYYVDLSSELSYPDFKDYFTQKKAYGLIIDTCIPIEGSRGCHWNRCHFCYLNQGYKYRTKSIDKIINEIKYMINEYNIELFEFLDNDLVGDDIERFEILLDELMIIRKEYPNFKIILAEIITKNLNRDIVYKMSQSGFTYTQIGYESPSNNLLKKINKKNTFSSNVLFIKFAIFYKIYIGGANVIIDLLEETDDDVLEAIENLKFLRFFLSTKMFTHIITKLYINHSSRYYQKIKNNLDQWTTLYEKKMISNNLIDEKDELYLFDFEKKGHNRLWDLFKKTENHFIQNKYQYKLIKNEDCVIYEEYFNKKIVNKFEFSTSSLEWKIMLHVNNEVVSLKLLCKLIFYCDLNDFYSCILINALNDLYIKKIIYHDEEYEEIVSIINTDIVEIIL